MSIKINIDTLSINDLKRLDEVIIRKEIVIPLLIELGAENVIDLHGPNEQGIDVYFEWFDLFSHRKGFGIQIKRGDIVYKSESDKNKNILTICNQIKMAFSREIIFADSKNRKVSIHIDGHYVLISGKASQNAINFIYQERKAYPYVHLIDGNELIQIIRMRKILRRKGTNLKAINQHYSPIINTDIEGKNE